MAVPPPLRQPQPWHQPQQQRQRPYLSHVQQGPYPSWAPNAFDVTILTQTSVDRLWKLDALCRLWEGPISVAIYAARSELADARAWMARSRCASKTRVAYVAGEDRRMYPFNALRNVARRVITTSHFFVTDIDLWPSEGTYATLVRLLREPWARSAKAALIVPVFATDLAGVTNVPLSLRALKPCVTALQCYSFDGFPAMIADHQLTTNYPEWYRRSIEAEAQAEAQVEAQAQAQAQAQAAAGARSQAAVGARSRAILGTRRRSNGRKSSSSTNSSDVYKVPCFDTAQYEPYLIVPNRPSTPLFDEHFVGTRTGLQWTVDIAPPGPAHRVAADIAPALCEYSALIGLLRTVIASPGRAAHCVLAVAVGERRGRGGGTGGKGRARAGLCGRERARC
jgi:hypothetical protein